MLKKGYIFSLLCSFLMLSLCMLSCSDDDDKTGTGTNDPGRISGLGNNRGELTGTKFSLPEGINLKENIIGFWQTYETRSLSIVNNESALRATGDDYPEDGLYLLYKVEPGAREYDVRLGSGYSVPVWFVLENVTDKDINVEFPAGLIIKTHNWEAQYGLLVKKTEIVIPAKKSLKILLQMHCCHMELPAPEEHNILSWGVITDSPLLIEICNMVTDKKINIEEFSYYSETYFNQSYYIQERIWDLTDRGKSLTEEHRTWFRNLPVSE